MSSRVRCSLEWEGMKYLTNRQVGSAAAQLYRRYVGAYYRKVKPPEVPLWKYLAEMWESIPELPESARLRVWRERRGNGRKRRVVEAAPQRAVVTRTIPRIREQQVAMYTGVGRHELRVTTTQPQAGMFVNGNFVTTAVPTHIPLPINPVIQY